MDRYRGTQYDLGNWAPAMDAATVSVPVSRTANRFRTIVLVAFVAVLGLYGTMLVYTDLEAHQDQPAAAVGFRR